MTPQDPTLITHRLVQTLCAEASEGDRFLGSRQGRSLRANPPNKRTNKMKPIRQGDVLIWPCDAIPAGAVPVDPENGRLIVARGEATGHHHSFPHRPEITLFRDDGSGGGFYVRADIPVSLEHQEHSALRLAPGVHKVSIQRTFVAGMARRVAD